MVSERALEMIRLYNDEKLTLQEVADRFGVSRQAVQQAMKKVGAERRTVVEHHQYQRSLLPIADIINAHEDGESLYALAKYYKVTPETMRAMFEREGVTPRNLVQSAELRRVPGLTKEKLWTLYVVERFSQIGIARMFRTTQGVISRYIIEWGINHQDANEMGLK